MSQSLAQVYLHIVFSTKDRQPLLVDRDLRNHLHAYLTGICQNQGSPPLRVGGVEDHVHILCRMAKVLSIADLIRELKRDSSKWVKEQDHKLSGFHWQSGYGAFSLSPSHVDPLIEYIADQMSHHQQESFKDEFRRICEKYGAPMDERYVWD